MLSSEGRRFPWLPVRDWLLQVVAVQQAVPEQVVAGALGRRVVVDGGMGEERTGDPAGLAVQDCSRPLAGLAPVVTHGLCRRKEKTIKTAFNFIKNNT